MSNGVHIGGGAGGSGGSVVGPNAMLVALRPKTGVPLRTRALAVIKQPKIAFVLVIADSALTVLNQTTFGLPKAAQTALTILLGAFAFLGVGPVIGPKFRAFIHLDAKLAGAISLVLLGLEVVVQQDASLPYSAIILGVIQFCGGLGFAPAYIPTA